MKYDTAYNNKKNVYLQVILHYKHLKENKGKPFEFEV